MPTRRLFILFTALGLGAVILVLRLGHMQVLHAQRWQDEARSFTNRHYIIATTRGAIIDRDGRILAEDVPCTDLAIDYRAMNYDDGWITHTAIDRLKAQGVADRKERLTRLPDAKARIADQLDSIPARISERCNVPVEDIKLRFEAIRKRIEALREDRWTCAYDRARDRANIAAEYDPELDQDFREEHIAHTVVPNISDADANFFQKHADDFPGITVIKATRRVYPYGEVAAHVIGALRPIAESDLYDFRDAAEKVAHPRTLLPHFERPDLLSDKPGDLHGYLPGDDVGAFGIERYMEDALRGTRGVKLVDINGAETLAERQPPVPGKTVRTTLDAAMQQELTRAVLAPNSPLRIGDDQKPHNVALVVMSMDGEVLTLLSTPTFDLNTYSQDIRELAADRMNLPLLNRAISASYPPGSTVKPLVAAAALTTGVTTPTDIVVCNGHLYPNKPDAYRCETSHGPMQLVPAIEKSCNIYFYTMGIRLHADRLAQWFRGFGFGSPTGLGLREEEDGILISDRALARMEPDLAQIEATFMGIGQSGVSVTPLQLACAYATLLRDGVAIPPRLIADEPRTASRRLTIPPEHLATIRQAMRLVVTDGTAHRFLKLRIPVAGKTGSATDHQPLFTPDGKPVYDLDRPVLKNGQRVLGADGQPEFYQQSVEGTDAWFVGCVPADDPKFIVVAIMEFGGQGGIQATPLVHEAILALERHHYLPPLDLK